MALTKLYQIVELGLLKTVWKTYRTEQECLDYLKDNNISPFVPVTLSVLPIWTNASERDIEKMLR